jgi:hypothetical protein
MQIINEKDKTHEKNVVGRTFSTTEIWRLLQATTNDSEFKAKSDYVVIDEQITRKVEGKLYATQIDSQCSRDRSPLQLSSNHDSSCLKSRIYARVDGITALYG